MLGFSLIDLRGIRMLMFQLSGFDYLKVHGSYKWSYK